MDFLDDVDDDEEYESLREIKDPNHIWNFIQPADIYVSRRAYQEQDIYVQVACECDWEQEHGLQLVFRQGKKLTRISDNDGHLTEAEKVFLNGHPKQAKNLQVHTGCGAGDAPPSFSTLGCRLVSMGTSAAAKG